jgi:excisionase family DNA binding protein
MNLLTIPEVCDFLRISRSKLYVLWAEDAGPQSLWIGSQRRIRQTDLENWINSQAA